MPKQTPAEKAAAQKKATAAQKKATAALLKPSAPVPTVNTAAGETVPPALRAPVAPVISQEGQTQTIDTTTPPPVPSPVAPVVAVLQGMSENVLFDGLSMTFKQGTTFAQWEAVGLGLAQSTKVSQWCLGDWLNYGTGAFKKDYKAACAKTGLAYGTLRTAASVAKRFAPSARKLGISFEHHRLLAPVKDEGKVAEIIARVEKDGLSTAAMKELIPKAEKKALTPDQKENRDIAESNKQREHAEGLLTFLTQVEDKRLWNWVETFAKFARIDWHALHAGAEREAKASGVARIPAAAAV